MALDTEGKDLFEASPMAAFKDQDFLNGPRAAQGFPDGIAASNDIGHNGSFS